MTLTAAQRLFVKQRASYCCEYCRIAEGDRLSSFHIDHVVALKHGGIDDVDNLCFACYKCNGYKGSNVAAIDPITDTAVKLYTLVSNNGMNIFASMTMLRLRDSRQKDASPLMCCV